MAMGPAAQWTTLTWRSLLALVLLCLLGGRAWGQHVEHDKLPSNTDGQSLALAPVEVTDGPKLQVSGRFLSTTPKKPKDPKAPPAAKHYSIRLFLASPDKKLEQLKVVVQYFLQNPAGGDPVPEGTESVAVDYLEKLTAVTTKGYEIAKDKPTDPKAPQDAQGIDRHRLSGGDRDGEGQGWQGALSGHLRLGLEEDRAEQIGAAR